MKSLNIDPTPIASILEIVNTINIHNDLIFKEANELKQYLNEFPKFNSDQIQTLRDAKDDIMSITGFFDTNGFRFKLDDDEIMNLIKIINHNKNTEISKYASCVILVGFLSFVYHLFLREPIQFTICDALLHLDQSYVEIGLSSYLFAFKIIAKHKIDIITPDFLNSINFFYFFNFQYPVETVEVLYELISNAYKFKSINAIPFIHIVCQLPQYPNISFPPNLVDKFLTLFEPNFLDLQIDYIIAFSNLLHKATSFKFQSTISQLFQSVLNRIQNTPALPLPESNSSDQNHSISINDQTILSSSYFKPGFDFFEEPFDQSLLHKKCELTPIPNQIAESLCPLFKSAAFIKQYSSNFLNDLTKYIISKETHILELQNIYFQCCISSKEPLLSADIEQIFQFPFLNDPQITVFNSNSNPIFTIRKKMTEFLLVSGQSNFFRQFIQNAVKWPLFYAEILSYLIDLKKCLRIYLTNKNNLNFIFDSVNLYSKASQSCKDCDQRYVKEIKIGRSCVINFLSEMIDEYNDIIMIKDKIIFSLLGQLFERNLRDFTLNVLQKYLLKSKNSIATMNAISTVINGSIAQELLDDNNYNQCIELLISLFDTLNSVFEKKTNFDGIECVFISVSTLILKKKGNSIDFFYSYLDSLYLFRMKISLQHFTPFISKCLHILFEDEMDDKLYNSLVRFIQDEIIKSPEFLHLILHAFVHSSFFDKFMDLLNDLLKKRENKIICHNSGFDEYLIDLIYEDEDLHIQQRILNIFKEIALLQSSSSVVFKFISKLRPNDDSFLPNNEELLLEILRQLALDYYFETTSISFSCGKKYESNENKNDFNNEFTFYFWIFFHEKEKVENDRNEFSLLEIQNTFSIVLYNNRLFIKRNDSKYQINDVEKNWKWNLISISHSKEEESKLTIQVNNQFSEQKIDFDNCLFDFSKIKIGDEKLINNDVEICNISLIKKAKPSEIVKIYSEGPNKQKSSFSFEKVDSIENKEIENVHNFVYYLLHSWEIDIIMPLFALSDLNYHDQNRHFLSSFYYSMEIFVPAFLSLKNEKSDIFLALSCILSTYSPKSLTFSVYNRLYELYGFITDEETKDALFINILSNAEIWSHNDSEVDKIVKHWSKFLIDPFVKNFSFSFALNYFYQYLTFTDNRYNDRVKAIRIILLSIAKNHFTKEDFQNLIIECIGPINEISFLILQNLVYNIPNTLRSMNLELSDVIQLNKIIIYKNQISISYMIESIIILHKEKLIQNISLYEHLNLIMQDLPTTAIHEEFFSQMILLNMNFGVVELIPICAWYCFKEKDIKASKQFVSIFTEIESIKNIGILIWPAILALKSEESIKLSIIYHIADIFSDKWKEILILFDLICMAIQYDPKELQFYFMDYLLQQFFLLKEFNDMHEFIEYYCFLIFYQKQDNYCICQEMSELFENVYNEKSDKIKNPDLSYVFPSILNTNITKITSDQLKFSLILRNDRNDNHFTDDSRLKRIYEKIVEIHSGREETMIIKSILYLLDHQHHEFVEEQIQKNHFSSKELFQTPLFLRTFNQHNYIDIINDYKKIFKEILKTISDSINPNIFGFLDINIGYHMYEDFHSIVLQRRKKNRIIWARLWSSLSITKGPWDSKMVTEYRGPSRWKRDNTLCFAYCPMKMKRNFHFITHGKSIDKKPNPKIALALFADSSSDLLQFTTKEEKQKQKEKEKKKKKEKEKEIENQQLIVLSTTNPYSLSPNFSRNEKSTNLKKSNKLIQIVDCKLIKVIGEFDAKFLLFKNKIDIQVVNQKEKTIYNNKIKYILKKTRFHRVTAIEILTIDRMNYFIDFQNEEIWNSVIENLIKRIKINNFQPKLSFQTYFQTFNYTQMWKKREISNFEYLMHVNILSGRTFNDLSQYPFLPWILIDYNSQKLDLKDEKIYRPLCKPIGTIDPSNLSKILDRYKDFLDDVDETTKPYMFPSGPISPLSICLYLTRMEPFTTLHVQLQGGKFDVPDRLVTSIEQLFNGIIHGNAESWELSPEFFFQVEFLTNDNQFDLGKINNECIDDIDLPKWSISPFDFIYKHRKALESDFVSNHLNEWIDLHFGYLQKNVDFFNLYNDKLYEDVWQHYSFNDEKIKKIVETTLLMVGQIPPKMFKEPHPTRDEENFFNGNSKIQTIESPIKDSIFCVFYHGDDNDECILISISSLYELTTLSISIDNENIDDSVKILNNEQIHEILDKGRIYGQKFNGNMVAKSDKLNLNIKRIGNGKLAILDNESFLIYSFNQSKKYIFEIPFVQCISSSHDWTIFSTRESILNIYEKNKRISSTHQYRDIITCCTVSSTYQVIVTGTKDGGLIVGTFSGINVRVLELGRTPKKVMVTPGWGFIVAYTEEENDIVESKKGENKNSPEIVVYSLNGTFIRKLVLDDPIDHWIGWKSKSGFDFIAFSQGRKISYAEVYFLEKTHVVRVSRDLIGFTYLISKCTFVFIEKDGVIEKLYLPINDLYVG